MKKLEYIKAIQDFIMKMEQEIMKISRKYLLLGFTIVCFILFMRLFYVRVPHQLSTNIDLVVLVVYLFILSAFLFQTLLTLRNIFFPSRNLINKNKKIFKLIQLFDYVPRIIKRSFLALDTYIKENIFKNWVIWFIKLIKIVTKIPYQYILCLNWIFDFMIRFIVVLLFSIDVAYFHEFNLFYKAIPFLLIPLIFKYLLYNLNIIVETNIKDIAEVFSIKENLNIISSSEYCKLFTKKALLMPKKANNFFSDSYLLEDNLKQFTFQWTDSYIAANEIIFKDYNDAELSNFFLESYLVYNQLFVLTSIYLYTLDYNYKNTGLWISFVISSLYFFNWLYIITYGII